MGSDQSKPSNGQASPVLTLHGPDALWQLSLVGTNGHVQAMFALHGSSYKSFVITYLPGDGNPEETFCTASSSSSSLSTTFTLRGQEYKMKCEDDISESRRYMKTPWGKYKWKWSTDTGDVEVRDEQKNVVAKGSVIDTRLEIYLQIEGLLLELLLVSFAGIWLRAKARKKEDKLLGKAAEAAEWIFG